MDGARMVVRNFFKVLEMGSTEGSTFSSLTDWDFHSTVGGKYDFCSIFYSLPP
jgi:hypothetical protein